MTELKTVYSGNYIERRDEMRTDRVAIGRAFQDPQTRFLPVWNDRCLIRAGRPAMLRKDQVLPDSNEPERAIFLGQHEDRFVFAACLSGAQRPRFGSGCEFVGLRALTGTLPDTEAALLAYAKAMIGWQQRHLHCGSCGGIGCTCVLTKFEASLKPAISIVLVKVLAYCCSVTNGLFGPRVCSICSCLPAS